MLWQHSLERLVDGGCRWRIVLSGMGPREDAVSVSVTWGHAITTNVIGITRGIKKILLWWSNNSGDGHVMSPYSGLLFGDNLCFE